MGDRGVMRRVKVGIMRRIQSDKRSRNEMNNVESGSLACEAPKTCENGQPLSSRDPTNSLVLSRLEQRAAE